MKVRILLGVPFLLMLSCSTGPLKRNLVVTKTPELGGCESISEAPITDSEWSTLCYCTSTDEEFSRCIDNWTEWHNNQEIK